MKVRRRAQRDIRLNIAPLIDVIFILLIFVVLVARFVDQERLDVTVPSAEAGRPAEIDALLITVAEDGRIMIEEQLVSDERLADVLAAARPRFGRAVLVADEATKLQAAVDVISTAKLAGFEAVAVATRPPEP